MPTLMPSDVRNVLGQNSEKCDSRSLLLDRFVYDHPQMDEARKLHFAQVCGDSFPTISTTRQSWQAQINKLRQKEERERNQEKQQRWRREREKLEGYISDTQGLGSRPDFVAPTKSNDVCASRLAFLKSFPRTEVFLAQLQSRLMVNMSGGVMENAGLCLDRFGLPYIPGSAVKGCARRAALAALHEWCGAGDAPERKPKPPENPLGPVCEQFKTTVEMLVAIAQVFGWVEQDWSLNKKDGVYISDFVWACHGDQALLKAVAQQLAEHHGWEIGDRYKDKPWEALPNFSGSVSFLPAYPVDHGKTGKVDGLPLEVPPLGKLELDVVTCHHREYYASRDPNAVATDTEAPVPVVFPAVAPGHVFAFALVPLRGVEAGLVPHARTWLATGLSVFGLGAKTNAGYGWFDCSEEVQKVVDAELKKAQAKAEAKRQAEDAKAAAEKAEQERLATAPAHEKFRAEYAKLGDEPFAAQAKKYAAMTDDQRHGFILALKERRETAKRWAKKKPELLKPWQDHAQKLQPPIPLP